MDHIRLTQDHNFHIPRTQGPQPPLSSKKASVPTELAGPVGLRVWRAGRKPKPTTQRQHATQPERKLRESLCEARSWGSLKQLRGRSWEAEEVGAAWLMGRGM